MRRDDRDIADFKSMIETHHKQLAAVILEPIVQGAGGMRFYSPEYLRQVRALCDQHHVLLIADEIATGFGRTGKLFGFENFEVVPDIVAMGKGMGGGVPIGAFSASEELMDLLSDNPKMGHITTFGGNPLVAAACHATLKTILETALMAEALEKEKRFRELLVHPLINEVRGKGLMLAAIVDSEEIANQVILDCKEKGLILFWLLFEKRAVRITPPLTISMEEIEEGCGIIIDVLNKIKNKA